LLSLSGNAADDLGRGRDVVDEASILPDELWHIQHRRYRHLPEQIYANGHSNAVDGNALTNVTAQ
jgi:hypothetical protein